MIDTTSGKRLLIPPFSLSFLYIIQESGQSGRAARFPALQRFSGYLILVLNKILLKNDKFTLTINNICVRIWKKEVLCVLSFTMFFTPAMLALLILSLILLVRGVRRRSWRSFRASLGLFVLVCGCVSAVMEFISRM